MAFSLLAQNDQGPARRDSSENTVGTSPVLQDHTLRSETHPTTSADSLPASGRLRLLTTRGCCQTDTRTPPCSRPPGLWRSPPSLQGLSLRPTPERKPRKRRNWGVWDLVELGALLFIGSHVPCSLRTFLGCGLSFSADTSRH